MLRRLWRYRSLLAQYVQTQYRLRYRQSFLGLAWAILPPLGTLGAAILIFHRVAGVGSGGASYPVVTLAALTPWTFFASSLTFGVPSVVNAQPVVSRVAFPRAVLPLSSLGTALIDLAVSAMLFLAFAYGLGHGVPSTGAWFPLLLLVEMLFTAGVVLLGSALNAFARDVRLMVPVLVQLWLLITPVMYPLSAVPARLRPFFLANPMAGLVESFRRTLVLGRPPELSLLTPALIGAAIGCLLGTWYFAATENRFADVL